MRTCLRSWQNRHHLKADEETRRMEGVRALSDAWVLRKLSFKVETWAYLAVFGHFVLLPVGERRIGSRWDLRHSKENIEEMFLSKFGGNRCRGWGTGAHESWHGVTTMRCGTWRWQWEYIVGDSARQVSCLPEPGGWRWTTRELRQVICVKRSLRRMCEKAADFESEVRFGVSGIG